MSVGFSCLWNLCECFSSSKANGDDNVENWGGADSAVNSKDSVVPETQQGPAHAAVSGPGCAKKSDVYKALWAFEAREKQELSFCEGDLFTIIDNSGGWWTVEKIGRHGETVATGIVPYNYLAREKTLEAQPWYFGKLSRLESMKYLSGVENFMVRISEKDAIDLVLSVKINGKIKHFRIYQTRENKFYIYPSRCFLSLLDLVDHYRENCIAGTYKLGTPCTRRCPAPQDLSHTTVDKWELPKEEFIVQEKLGNGCFADVHRGMWKGRVSVAIKILKSDETLNIKDFLLETQILKKLHHRNLLTLLAVCSMSLPYYIITELMEKGDLQNFLRGEEGRSLSLPCLIEMAVQVADGMSYLESNNSIHRDLAARNVLVGEDYTCKVADFGLARVVKEPFYISNTRKMPYKWTAPEAISHQRFSIKSDVWSFGILLYEILTYGAVPYPGTTNTETYNLVSQGYRMPPPPRCPDNIYKIMLSCWDAKPDHRPSFMALSYNLNHINLSEAD
ncbi:tyrosine-protein kinase SRK3-like [Brienomyrus brachyistius]|uniref:tyrosine-protein kinase SRK3-like n=1 Tax=Brienomyrus brachyistius TaxID=42636 RepID=UPI0020B401A2|nr:tyrosine-protein kinase SRK3-like [Brienomyrus brachyistius]